MTTVVLNTVTRKVEVFSSARDVHARAEIADHKAAANPHPQYLADADLAEVAISGNAGDLIAGTVPDARMPNWTGYTLPSRTALEAANVPAAVVGLRLLGHAAVSDGGGAHYKRVASEPVHLHKIQSADGAWWEESFAADVTVNIPSDFATLQEAIDRLSKQPVRRGARINLNIESGHALTGGIVVGNGDYSRFWIGSEDAEIPLDAAWPHSRSFMAGESATFPTLNCLINAGNKGSVGIFVNNSSRVYVSAGCGVKNMGSASSTGTDAGTGIRVAHGSIAAIGGAVFSGAHSNGISATQAALVYASGADFSNAGAHGIFLSRGAFFHGHDCIISGAGTSAVHAGRAYASVRGSNLQNAGEAGIVAFEGSTVAARGCNVSGAGTQGVRVFQGSSIVDISAGTITGCNQNGIQALDGSKVIAEGATINTCGSSAILASDGATVVARGAVIDGAGGHANTVWIDKGSRLSMSGASVANSPGNGVMFDGGSSGNLGATTFTGSTTADIAVSGGSMVSADGATYSSISQTINLLTSAGVVFDESATSIDLYHRSNIVDAVSQSGGTPTGGVIERGNNANGQYTRFADGTQICWSSSFTISHVNDAALRGTWTFPAAFANSDYIITLVVPNNGSEYTDISSRDVGAPRYYDDDTTFVRVGITRIAGATVNPGAEIRNCRVMAIGRWF